jgi:hypothetical protein
MNPDEAYEHLLGLSQEVQAVRTPPPPKGWEPGVVWDGNKGQLTTSTLPEAPTDWSHILAERGLDPNIYEVVGDSIKWTSFDGWKRDGQGEDAYSAMCFVYRAEIRLKRPQKPSLGLEDLYKEARKVRRRSVGSGEIERTLVVCLSDWQVGNGDAGGHRPTIEAIAALPDLVTDQIKALKAAGQPIQHVIVAGLGDLGEGTCGFYPSQPFLTELDQREQSRVVRRGIKDVVVSAAQSVQRVTVTCAGGNHGENRENGKRQTGFNDNADVAAFEQVYEIVRETPLDNIQWRIPRDEMAVSVEAHGQYIAFTHGHLAKPQKNAAEALWNWWAGHAMGRYYQGVADANILVGGHFHHLNVKQQDKRTVMICPSLKPVGDWYSNATGVQTVEGTLTFTVDTNGWNNLRVLR